VTIIPDGVITTAIGSVFTPQVVTPEVEVAPEVETKIGTSVFEPFGTGGLKAEVTIDRATEPASGIGDAWFWVSTGLEGLY
jgi:hypothetical protein